jgi:7-cyano-7-deazaguanine synthase
MKSVPEAENNTGRRGEPVIALVSGGFDSLIMIGRALGRRPIFPLYVRQGALWEEAELVALRRWLGALEDPKGLIAPPAVSRLDLPPAGEAAWAIDPALSVPGADSEDAAVYLPGRNLCLLLQGALYARAMGARQIQIGLLAGNPFADSRPAFFSAFEQIFALATGYQLEVITPLAGSSKAELVREGAGLPLELTLSCLRPVDGRHCGRCNKCAERARAFGEAGVEDLAMKARSSKFETNSKRHLFKR